MLHASRAPISSEAVLKTGSALAHKRQKFLQRVVDEIEGDHFHRAFRRYLSTTNSSDDGLSVATEALSGPGRSMRGEGGRESKPGAWHDGTTLLVPGAHHVGGKKRGSRLSLSPSPRSSFAGVSPRPSVSLHDNYNTKKSPESAGSSLSRVSRNGAKNKTTSIQQTPLIGVLPKIRIRTAENKPLVSDSSSHYYYGGGKRRTPLSSPSSSSSKTTTATTTKKTTTTNTNTNTTSPHHRQTPLVSSGSFYGFSSTSSSSSSFRPPTPQAPTTAAEMAAAPPPRTQMLAWKICTPTNWKRIKSQHEILLERKWQRRNGKLAPQVSRFVSVFKMKDGHKLTAADRIRTALKRAHFYGDDIKRLPLVRFRRAARTLVALLKTVKISGDEVKDNDVTWLEEENLQASRRAYEMFGVSFDVYSYRAKREIQVSNEAKAILTMAPGTRSDEQMHAALVSLSQAVPEFGEFPKAMQEALVRVGWYETFEARRIIIREGHMADNFYLILSGAAIVTIREKNGAGDYFGRTAAVLQRGNSFGELALIYGGKRSATVTCKNNVELLAVGRDDYIDIFMHKTKDGGEPEHIKFLKQIKVFCGWPVVSLPLDDPSVFLYTYVRRGVVLCKDSNKSEWIFVIKSGSCRVLTALHAVKPSIQANDKSWDHSKEIQSVMGSTLSLNMMKATGGHNLTPPCTHRGHARRLSPLRSAGGDATPPVPGGQHQCVHGMTQAHRLPSINARTDHDVQAAAALHVNELDEILKKRIEEIEPLMANEVSSELDDDPILTSRPMPVKHKSKKDRIFVNLQTLAAKDVYGLESVVMSVFEQPTATSLVSDGAECIMISKKFFQQKLKEEVAKEIRKEVRPLPSEEVLQEKLQTKTDWDTYRAITVADFVDFRKHVHDFLV